MKGGSEHDHAVALMRWWAYEANLRKIDQRLLFHVPNGGLRNRVVAAKLFGEGVRAGIPDYFLAVPRGQFKGLFVELKSPEGRLADTQAEMLSLLESQGFKTVVAYGWEKASILISAYLTPA